MHRVAHKEIAVIDREPKIRVGLMERQPYIQGCLQGTFHTDCGQRVNGRFMATAAWGNVVLSGDDIPEIRGRKTIGLMAASDASFLLSGVTIGIAFHWQQREDLAFRGNLKLLAHEDNTLAAINEIDLEAYLTSVISSEMSESAPLEFLKAHAIISRSWLVATLQRKVEGPRKPADATRSPDEISRWYGREEHRCFDVCADDHCQRYQGITRSISGQPAEAVASTRGIFLVFDGSICDARYYKACGGLTEDFDHVWEDIHVPYLTSVSDAPHPCSPVLTEEEARSWLLASPDAYCNVSDPAILRRILPSFDQPTGDFFRWQVTYGRKELESILREKSGLDFGTLIDLIPLSRGPSGRIFRLMIKGTQRTVVVGKELEIRRWLSRSHLLSSAFIILTERGDSGIPRRFILKGGGWGHGVGLCQIGAAVMALKGFSAEAILKHYFRGTQLQKLY